MLRDCLSPDQLRALLVTLLAGATGSSEAKWRKLLGPVEQLNLTFHPRSNWRIEPGGTSDDRHAIERVLEVVQQAHLYVNWR